MKTKILLVIAIIAVVLCIVIANSSQRKDEDKADIQISQAIEISDYAEVLKEILNETEQQYQEVVANSNIYSRSDFYNEARLTMNSEEAKISVVNLDDIYSNKIYNASGEPIDELPNPMFYEQNVEIANSTEFKLGNYYLFKYSPTSEEYSYYYISELTNNGFQDLELYIVAEVDELL